MTKDEMKNRISMALKDPILQQGFEIICKENAELASELQRCRDEIGRLQGLLADEVHKHKVTKDKLTEAKEIITALLNIFVGDIPEEDLDVGQIDCREKAEQFLKEGE